MKAFLVRGLIVPGSALALGLGFGALLLWMTGYPVWSTYRDVFSQCFTDWYGFGQVLRQTSLLTMTGLAAAIAFRAGMLNIGIEGQALIGCLAAGLFGWWLGPMVAGPEAFLAPSVGMVLIALVGMVAGALWALVPAVMRAYLNVQEVITTMMMNFIAAGLVMYVLRPGAGKYVVPGSVKTAAIVKDMRLPQVSTYFEQFQGSKLSVTILFSMLLTITAGLWLFRTARGFEFRVVGMNPDAARQAGVRARWTMLLAMLMSGAVAGLICVDFVLGTEYRFENGMTASLGYTGLVVALLAANNPYALPVSALLFGVLSHGRVAAGSVPKEIIDVMEALVIIGIIVAPHVVARVEEWHRRRGRKSAPEAVAAQTT